MQFRYRQYSLDGKRRMSYLIARKRLWPRSIVFFYAIPYLSEGTESIGTDRLYAKSVGLSTRLLGIRHQIRPLAVSSSKTAKSSAQAITVRPARRTPKSGLSAKPAKKQKVRRSTSRSNRAPTMAGRHRAHGPSSSTVSEKSSSLCLTRIPSWPGREQLFCGKPTFL